jgi:hypothetical protein
MNAKILASILVNRQMVGRELEPVLLTIFLFTLFYQYNMNFLHTETI